MIVNQNSDNFRKQFDLPNNIALIFVQIIFWNYSISINSTLHNIPLWISGSTTNRIHRYLQLPIFHVTAIDSSCYYILKL